MAQLVKSKLRQLAHNSACTRACGSTIREMVKDMRCSVMATSIKVGTSKVNPMDKVFTIGRMANHTRVNGVKV